MTQAMLSTDEELAAKLAGNWMKFRDFGWHDRPDEHAEDWGIVYTHNRDSGLVAQSNAAAIGKAMQPFLEAEDPDIRDERHNHFVCGWVDGYAIRVYRDGKITEAAMAYFELMRRLEDYGILDENDYCDREMEATLANFKDAAWRLKNKYELPEGWESAAYAWMSMSAKYERDIERRDDGAYPSEEALEAAFVSLGYPLDPDWN